jgi:1-deoxyxylulose-5-phosphate synthase
LSAYTEPRRPLNLRKTAINRDFGASSMAAWQFTKYLYLADIHGWTRFVTMQNHYNLVYREEEREMIPVCKDQNIGCIPWSPVARGFLAGNRPKPGVEQTYGRRPMTSAPIIGASKISHLEDALDAMKIKLSPEDKAALEEPYRPHPAMGLT